jgi:hypothetical protein
MEELREFHFNANVREAVRSYLTLTMEKYAIARLLAKEDVNIADTKAIIDTMFSNLKKEFEKEQTVKPFSAK